MNLFDLASNNKKLKFIDDENQLEFNLKDLPELGLDQEPKKLIFAYLDNSIQSILVFWTLMKINHCIALLPPNISLNFKIELESLYQPSYIFDNSRNIINGNEKININSIQFFKTIIESKNIIHKSTKILISTSGTTGSPKFVKLSEENLISNANSITEYLPINESDVTPLNLPIYYSYGLSVLTSNSIKGGKIVCTNDDVLKKSFWEKFEKLGFTSFAGVPFVYEMLDRIGFTKKTYASLRYFTQAGGKLHENLVIKYGEYAISNKVSFYVMYGQTEATARMSYLPPNLILQKTGSIGKAIPNGEFILDTETNELCYKGSNVFGGYVEKPSDLEIFESNDVLKTGDIAKVDDDGYFYIIGRIKRFTKLFGNRINLDEVENIIAKQLNIITKCIGVNDKNLIIFCSDNSVDLKNLNQFISSELKIHVSVIKSFYIEQFPLTNNGKINYTALTELYVTK